MKTLAHSCAALALSFVALAPFAIACSSAPESSSLGGNDDDVTPSKSKKTEDDDTVDSKKKSDTSAPIPTPSQTQTAPPAPTPTPTPTTPAVPTVDPNACANLGSCCSKITNTYGQLACVAVQIRGDAETCQKSLLGCLAAVGLGGGGGGGAGANCASDNDCLGGRRCNINGTCQ